MTDKQSPEDIERSERLFQMLAAEEPPIDIHSDTAPAKTAPRPAVVMQERYSWRYFLPGGLILLLVTGIVVAVLLRSSDGAEQHKAEISTESAPVNVVQNPTANRPTSVPTEVRTTSTPLPVAAETTVPTIESPEAVSPLPDVLPTAAVDEIAVSLSQPPLLVAENSSVRREVEPFTITGLTGRSQVITYTVQPGDTLSRIAETFNLDVCTVVWSNPRNRVSPLRPGNVLNILPVDGVFYKVDKEVTIQQIAEQTGVPAYSIIDSPFNQLFGLSPDTILVEGMKIVVPDGKGGDCNIWTAPTVVNAGSGDGTGSISGGGVSSGSLWGCNYSGGAGGFPANNPLGSSSYKFWQGFSSGHTGVDLSAAVGTPVLAAGGGTVAFAGWTDGGYGNAVIIDHGGSYSLYAHMSSVNVSCGQSVGALEVIGGVGSTGRSSGPHLHFEIRDSGFNPLDPTYSISGGL